MARRTLGVRACGGQVWLTVTCLGRDYVGAIEEHDKHRVRFRLQPCQGDEKVLETTHMSARRVRLRLDGTERHRHTRAMECSNKHGHTNTQYLAVHFACGLENCHDAPTRGRPACNSSLHRLICSSVISIPCTMCIPPGDIPGCTARAS